jgi:hypothetical protein
LPFAKEAFETSTIEHNKIQKPMAPKLASYLRRAEQTEPTRSSRHFESRKKRIGNEVCCDQEGFGICGVCLEEDIHEMKVLVHHISDTEVSIHCICTVCAEVWGKATKTCWKCNKIPDSEFTVYCGQRNAPLDQLLRSVVVISDDDESETAVRLPHINKRTFYDMTGDDSGSELDNAGPAAIDEYDLELNTAGPAGNSSSSSDAESLFEEEDVDREDPVANIEPDPLRALAVREWRAVMDAIIVGEPPVMNYIGVYQRHASMLFHGQPAVPFGGEPVFATMGRGVKQHENRNQRCNERYIFKWCALIATKTKWDDVPPPGLRLGEANRAAWDSANDAPKGFCIGLLFLGNRKHMNDVECDANTLEWVTGVYSHEVLFAVPMADPFPFTAPQGDIKRSPLPLLQRVQAYFGH